MNILDLFVPSVPLLPPPKSIVEEQVISEDVFQKIKMMAESGISKRQIARLLELHPQTVRAYLRKGERTPYSRPAPIQQSLGELQEWLLVRAPEVRFNGRVLFEEARLKGFQGCYETVKRFLRPIRKEMQIASESAVRFETAPGQQGQVDWGSSFVWLGEERVRVHFFVLVLGYSRRSFAHGYLNERLGNLLDGHLRAFEWFGGYPHELLYDNARTMVVDRQQEVIRLHPGFADFVEHHGFEARFCRPYRPRTKGKVESGVKYLKRNFLVGRRFRDLEHLNAELERWLQETADRRIHGTTHVAPITPFPEEASCLTSLNRARPWTPSDQATRRVARDFRIDFQTNRYPVPPEATGKEVEVRVVGKDILILDGSKELVRYPRLEGTFQEAKAPFPIGSLPIFPAQEQSLKPCHDPRWGTEEVQVRDLQIYDKVSQIQEVAA